MNDDITDRARRHLPLWPDTDNPDHDLIADLVAEVERLRQKLDQRTDPELANELLAWCNDDLAGVNEDDLRTAARLIGGDR